MGFTAQLAVNVYFSINLSIHVILCGMGLFLLHRYREEEFIKSRSPLPSALLLLLNAFIIAMSSLNMILDFSCTANIIRDFLWMSFAVTMFLFRCSVVYIKFQIAHESLAVHELKRKFAKENEQNNKNSLHSQNSQHSRRNSASSVRQAEDKPQKLQELDKPAGSDSVKATAQVKNQKDKVFTIKDLNMKYTKLKPYISQMRILAAVSLLMFVLFVPSLYFMSSVDPTGNCFLKNTAYNGILNFYRAICVIIVAYFCYVFHKEPLDHFWLHGELKFLLIFGLPCIILWFGIRTVLSSVDQNVFPVSTLFSNILYLLLVIGEILYPAYLISSRRLSRREIGSISSNDLESIVQSEEGEASFVKFLELEFSLENWLFVRDVWSLKEACHRLMPEAAQSMDMVDRFKLFFLTDPDELLAELRKLARRIYDDYVTPTSPLQVNLAFPQVKHLEEQMKSVDTMDAEQLMTLFKVAEKEIFNLVQKDSFRRYLRSPMYKQFKAEVRRKSIEHLALEHAMDSEV